MVKKLKKKKNISHEEVYDRLMENYKEWRELMDLLKKEERDLRREFLRFADQAKIQKVMKSLHN